MTPNERRTKIGQAVIDAVDPEYLGATVEGLISGMTGCELRDFVGRTVVEEMARSIGMEYPEEK